MIVYCNSFVDFVCPLVVGQSHQTFYGTRISFTNFVLLMVNKDKIPFSEMFSCCRFVFNTNLQQETISECGIWLRTKRGIVSTHKILFYVYSSSGLIQRQFYFFSICYKRILNVSHGGVIAYKREKLYVN